jgi:hypothetical protein
MLAFKWLYDNEYLMMWMWWVMFELVNDMWMTHCLTKCKLSNDDDDIMTLIWW